MRYNSMPKGEAFFIVEAGEIDSFLMEIVQNFPEWR